MRIRSNNWLCRRVCVAALMLASIAGWSRADSIIFTPPAVPLAVPAKEEAPSPKARDEIDFSGATQRPMVPMQPQIIQRQQPREYDPDDERNKHPLLRDWKKMPDPLSRELPKSPTQKWMEKNEAKKKEDSLSPVTTFDWRERDNRERDRLGRKDSLADKRALQKREREEERGPDPFRLRKEQETEREQREKDQRNPFQAFGLYAPDSLTSREIASREKAMLAESDSRATFQELLNPRPIAPATVKRSSLEPVMGFDAPKPPPPPVIVPIVNSSQIVRGPVDPTKAFEERQKRSQSSSYEDPSVKYGTPSKQASAVRTEPAFSTPLLRQPITRDFPTRNF